MGGLIALLLVIVLALLFIAAIMIITSIITLWKLFTKAGQPGWASFVPVYNIMIMAKIGERPTWVGVTAGVLSIISYVYSQIGNIFLSGDMSIVYINMFIVLLLSGTFIGLYIYILIGCMSKYDKGVLIWLLFWFLPFIAVFIVGKVRYIGDGAGSYGQAAYANPAGAPLAANMSQQAQAPQFAQSPTPQQQTVITPVTAQDAQPSVVVNAPEQSPIPQPVEQTQPPDAESVQSENSQDSSKNS